MSTPVAPSADGHVTPSAHGLVALSADGLVVPNADGFVVPNAPNGLVIRQRPHPCHPPTTTPSSPATNAPTSPTSSTAYLPHSSAAASSSPDSVHAYVDTDRDYCDLPLLVPTARRPAWEATTDDDAVLDPERAHSVEVCTASDTSTRVRASVLPLL
ncbi:hypothetical protein OF83DRAFT_1174437 [Amylostereum chailletii]|nr:hypothetical protein OF83DRAFT_1174437 [Amylostereum chailletii]